jgi:hypothetical protein
MAHDQRVVVTMDAGCRKFDSFSNDSGEADFWLVMDGNIAGFGWCVGR